MEVRELLICTTSQVTIPNVSGSALKALEGDDRT